MHWYRRAAVAVSASALAATLGFLFCSSGVATAAMAAIAASALAVGWGRSWGVFVLLGSAAAAGYGALSGALPPVAALPAALGAGVALALLPYCFRFDALASTVATALILATATGVTLSLPPSEGIAAAPQTSCEAAPWRSQVVSSSDGTLHWIARAHYLDRIAPDNRGSRFLVAPGVPLQMSLERFSWQLYLQTDGCTQFVGWLPSVVDPFGGHQKSHGLLDLVLLDTAWWRNDVERRPRLTRYVFDGARYHPAATY